MANITTIEELKLLFRDLSDAETVRAEALIGAVEDTLRQEADRVGKDIDVMIASNILRKDVFVSVVSAVVGRVLNTSTTAEPVVQTSQSGLGYTASATYLVPGGGIFIKNSELKTLGLRRQQMGMVSML